LTTASGGPQSTFLHYEPDEPIPSRPLNPDASGYHVNSALQQPVPVPLQEQTSYYAKNPPTNPVQTEYQQSPQAQQAYGIEQPLARHDSTYGNWMTPAAGGAALGALGAGAYAHHQQQEQDARQSQPFATDPTSAAQPNTLSMPVPLGSEHEPDSVATTPSAAHQPFLGGPEAVLSAAASEKAVNGGPVHPGMKRQGTDFSVSDLHVPGEYPKTPGV